MTPRQRWAIAWRTVRYCKAVERPEHRAAIACRGSGNTTGRPSGRVPLSLDRSKGWFLFLSFADPGGYREGWVYVFRRNLRRSRAKRESWEALP